MGLKSSGAPISALFLSVHLSHPSLSQDSHCFALMSVDTNNAKAYCFTTKKGKLLFSVPIPRLDQGLTLNQITALQDGILCFRKVLTRSPSIHAGKGEGIRWTAWRILWWLHAFRGNKLSLDRGMWEIQSIKNEQSLILMKQPLHDLCTDNDTVVTWIQLEKYIRWL